jgi:CHASE2 domain-containing sensor protein
VLQWLAEWGTPVALLLIGLWAAGGMALAAYVRRTAAQGDDRAQFFRVALLAALTGASAQAMVDGVLVMPVSQMLLVLLAGWAMGVMWQHKPIQIIGTTERVLLALTVFFAATVSVWGVAPEIGDLLVRYNAFIEVRYENEILLPRFWTQGWIRP